MDDLTIVTTRSASGPVLTSEISDLNFQIQTISNLRSESQT